ncbi:MULTISPECIES: hypothetical protein [Streptomyces]|uniref:hypothetical protein n=1 Tax=Streptomyces TaxID=1883 RepID=UPI001FD7765F|nr:hypothetical protein [Streptomyces durhamensis]
MAMAGTTRTAGDDRLDPPVVTRCGRRIAVRCLWLGRPDRPVGRITLDVGEDQGGEPGVWAALTPEEARGLARLLLHQAGAAEQAATGRP